MKRQYVFALFLFHTCVFQVRSQTHSYHMPAEWEKHDAVWVGWEMFTPFTQPALNVISALLPYVPVKVVVESPFSAQVAKEYLHLRGIDSSKPEFHVMRDNRIWIRDHGATFMVDDNGNTGFVDFEWTHYGIREWLQWTSGSSQVPEATYRQVLRRTGSIDSLMGMGENATRFSTGISLEGGSIEVNGKGVLILCEAVTLQRNPGKSKEYIEEEFKRLMNVKKIIWLKRGLAEDPHIIRPITANYIGFGTGGHTDEYVRFANEHTILLAWVDEKEKDRDPITRMNYDRLSENLAILERSTDQNGNSFHIIKVPLPDLLTKKVRITNYQKNENDPDVLSSWLSGAAGFKAGDSVYRVAAASYLNYFVTNHVVLLPLYSIYGSSETKERSVKKIMADVFPGRKIIMVDVMNLNYEGGGIHCITQQQPARH